MKKTILIGAALLTIASFAFAQEEKSSSKANGIFTSYSECIKEHNIIVNAGVGIDSNIFTSNSRYFIPTIGVSVEYIQPVADLPFGFGGYLGFNASSKRAGSFNDPFSGNKIDSYFFKNNIDIAAMANYHINPQIKNLDVYASLRLGVTLDIERQHYAPTPSPETNVKDSSSLIPKFFGGLALGGTYYFTDLIGANLEIGYPSLVKASVSLKF